MKISIEETYKNKNILLFGGIGFLGKVLLTMLLTKVANLKKITLIIRCTSLETAEERFAYILNTSPVFDPLRKQFKEKFTTLMMEKVQIIRGDVSLPFFGIQNEILYNHLLQEVDLVINSAGLVSFNPELKLAMEANVYGTIHIAEFIKKSKKSLLLHISTCFVSGCRNGIILENIHDFAPNGKPFDVSLELQQIKSLLSIKELSKKSRFNEAISNAKKWGWPNIYTYTKAMSEYLLKTSLTPNSYTIVRPSIVESAVEFPFPGWNEGYNTSAPFLDVLDGWYPFVISKNELSIDLIPIDILCSQIIKIGATLIKTIHKPVYQCSTSHKNPLYMKQLLDLTRKHQKAQKQHFLKKLQLLFNYQAIPPHHFLSSMNLEKFSQKLPLYLITKFPFVKKKLRELQSINSVYTTLLPFLYENNYIFIADNIKLTEALEDDFNKTVTSVDWTNYWPNIHMPGVKKWCR